MDGGCHKAVHARSKRDTLRASQGYSSNDVTYDDNRKDAMPQRVHGADNREEPSYSASKLTGTNFTIHEVLQSCQVSTLWLATPQREFGSYGPRYALEFPTNQASQPALPDDCPSMQASHHLPKFAVGDMSNAFTAGCELSTIFWRPMLQLRED